MRAAPRPRRPGDSGDARTDPEGECDIARSGPAVDPVDEDDPRDHKQDPGGSEQEHGSAGHEHPDQQHDHGRATARDRIDDAHWRACVGGGEQHEVDQLQADGHCDEHPGHRLEPQVDEGDGEERRHADQHADRGAGMGVAAAREQLVPARVYGRCGQRDDHGRAGHGSGRGQPRAQDRESVAVQVGQRHGPPRPWRAPAPRSGPRPPGRRPTATPGRWRPTSARSADPPARTLARNAHLHRHEHVAGEHAHRPTCAQARRRPRPGLNPSSRSAARRRLAAVRRTMSSVSAAPTVAIQRRNPTVRSPQVRSSAGVRATCRAEPGTRSCSRSAVATGCPGSPSQARISVGVRIWAICSGAGRSRRRGPAHDGRQQRLVDVHRPDGCLCEHRRAGLRPHPAHERLFAVALDEQRARAVHTGLRGAARPGRRRAGEHEPVEALRGERHRVQERRGAHRRADAADRAAGTQDVEQGQQVEGQVGQA